MPRSIRHEYEGAVYHVMCRGNNGQDIFRDDKGRRLFLSTLEDVCLQTGWRIHAYVLMSNHYHILLETPEANLVAGMKWFQGTYTQRFNAMFRCRGHLFQGRYKALPIDIEDDASYLRCVADYIHLNPFRAGLAGFGHEVSLNDYKWSSFPAYIGRIRKVPDWLERKRVLSACGIEFKSGCYLRYMEFVEHRMRGERAKGALDDVVENQLRRGWFIGGEGFRKWLAGRVPFDSDNLRGDQRRAHNECEAERLLSGALNILGITEAELLGLKNNSLEKQVVAWLLKSHTTVTGVWIADRLGMGDRSNVSRALSAMKQSEGGSVVELKQKMTQCTG